MIDTPLLTADLTLRVVAVTLLLLTAAALVRDQGHSLAARLGALLAASAAAHAVRSAPWFPAEPALWSALLIAVATGAPVLFWLFSRALFVDQARGRPWHALVWFAMALAGALQCLVWAPGHGTARVAAAIFLTVAPLAFVALAVLQSLASWRADLVERRRRLRLFIVCAASVHIVATTLSGILATRAAPFVSGTWVDAAVLALIAMVVAWGLLGSPASSLFPAQLRSPLPLGPPAELPKAAAPTPPGQADAAVDPAPPAAPEPHAGDTPPAPVDPELLAALTKLVTVDEVFREEALSIGSLADRLGVPEYKLRRLINQGLGHRNFNTFINGYRLAAAKRALSDPAQQATAVLAVAMDCGFQSLGPFNRAFKADTGMTPTEYRRARIRPAGDRPPHTDAAGAPPSTARNPQGAA